MKHIKLYEEFTNESTTSWKKMMQNVNPGNFAAWSDVDINDLKKHMAKNKQAIKKNSSDVITILKKLFTKSTSNGKFDSKPGEIETIEFENDNIFISYDEFDTALEYLSGLNNLSEIIKVRGYTVTFERQGDIIVANFKVK